MTASNRITILIDQLDNSENNQSDYDFELTVRL